MKTWDVLKNVISTIPTRSVKDPMRHKRKSGMFLSFKYSIVEF